METQQNSTPSPFIQNSWRKSAWLRPALATLLIGLFCGLMLTSCSQPRPAQTLIQVELAADGSKITLEVPSGSTVQQALDQAGLKLETLDRTDPPVYSLLRDGAKVRLVRVSETFEVDQVAIPYEQQTLRNESLPVEKEVLIQKGKNGVQEITYRRVYEDGVQVSNQPIPVKSVIVEKPQPEIRMIGVQTPFAPLDIPGKLYYLRDGNVWMIEGNTANRKTVLTAGDLDGRVFSVSADGEWLLFTRKTEEEGQINSLWAAKIPTFEAGLSEPSPDPVSLGVKNVVHFADWYPGSSTRVVFSTVEPRQAAPGWQANNDLQQLNFSSSGWTTKWTTVIEPNSGGVYGWWGTNFAWAPDGKSLAFARPDSVGIVDYRTGIMTTTLNILPLQTHADWAWVPGITWGPDGKAIYTLDHVAQSGAANPEELQAFDLTALLLDRGPTLHLISQTGMFSYPLASPLQEQSGSVDYQVAFLQALFPEQSETSRYALTVIDRDGSNRRRLFPADENSGMEPQQFWGDWSPAPLPESDHFALAVIYQGNLWIVDASDGKSVQITGDGLTARALWQ